MGEFVGRRIVTVMRIAKTGHDILPRQHDGAPIADLTEDHFVSPGVPIRRGVDHDLAHPIQHPDIEKHHEPDGGRRDHDARLLGHIEAAGPVEDLFVLEGHQVCLELRPRSQGDPLHERHPRLENRSPLGRKGAGTHSPPLQPADPSHLPFGDSFAES
jgi:hypothetical protein